MNKQSKIKIFCYTIFTLFLFLIISEIISFILLSKFLNTETTIDYYGAEKLLKKFPAQFRIKNDEIRSFFPRALPFKKAGNFMSFPFDPVLGFRAHFKDAVEWYGEKTDLNNKFIILTFGGSTTVKNNWPTYLIKYAKKAGVRENIVILNAGHWGYMTFLEKLYFSSWILPILEQKGIKPDLVLSMDGVNDVWTRLMGFLESKKQKSSVWYNHYHGYHQQLDTDLAKLGNLRESFIQFVSSASRKSYAFAIQNLSPVIPYSMKAFLEIMRIMIQSEPDKDDKIILKKLKKIKLLDQDENKLIYGFKTSLLDFLGVVKIRNIDFVGYLQPVLHPQYHPLQDTSKLNYPSIDYYAVNFHRENKLWSRLEGNPIDTKGIYLKIEKMYKELKTNYPKNFSSLIYIFENFSTTDQLYKQDAIHYESEGKKIIAKAVINDLLTKKILNKKL